MGKSIELADDDLDRFVGIPEAAARLGLHADTARGWIRTGRWEREFPTLPVSTFGGKQQVSLRHVVDLIHGRTGDRAAS